MMEQSPIDDPDPKPDEKPPEAPPAVGTHIKGNGPPDGFGLKAGGSGFALGGDNGSARAHSPFGWYAAQVQATIADALRNNRRTRSADLRLKVRIWPDAAGRIIRVKLSGSSGDLATDEAIKNEVLAGLQLQEPPPPGMPLPIVMRLTARRPN